MHYSLDEFEFRPDLINDYTLSKLYFYFFFVAIDKMLFKLACNEDIRNILNEFKFQLDWIINCGVSRH